MVEFLSINTCKILGFFYAIRQQDCRPTFLCNLTLFYDWTRILRLTIKFWLTICGSKSDTFCLCWFTSLIIISKLLIIFVSFICLHIESILGLNSTCISDHEFHLFRLTYDASKKINLFQHHRLRNDIIFFILHIYLRPSRFWRFTTHISLKHGPLFKLFPFIRYTGRFFWWVLWRRVSCTNISTKMSDLDFIKQFILNW